jgi:DNA polymerase-3 subunit beta
MPEQDFPALPGQLPVIGRVGGDAFADAVARIGPAVGRDPEKGVLFSGAYLGFGASELTLMATDRYRVARMILPWTTDGQDAGRTVAPGAALVEAAASFVGPDEVVIGSDGMRLSLNSPTRTLTVQLLEIEKYSATTLTTWLDFPTRAAVTFSASDLRAPLKRASVISGKAPVRLTLEPGAIVVDSRADLIPQSGGEPIDAKYDGDPITFGFNPGYLGAALASAPGDEVTMSFADPGKPAVFRVEGNEAWTHMVVPVRLLS